MNRILSGGVLALYLMTLIWLVLFKLSFHLSMLQVHHRSLNLVPFAAPSIANGRTNYGEIIANCIVFIPFGLLLCVHFKKPGFIVKFLWIVCFSLSAELNQYIFGIGATDITDLITNSLGGLIGLSLYAASHRYVNTTKLDNAISISAGILILMLIGFHTIHFMHRS